MSELKSPADMMLEIGNKVAASIEEGQGRYRILRKIALFLVIIFSLVLGSIVGLFLPENGVVVSQAAQSLVDVDGFLAAASGVIAFFYSARLLEFASSSSSLMLAMRPMINAEANAAMKELEKNIQALATKLNLSRTLTPQEVRQGQKAVFDSIATASRRVWEGTGRIVRNMSSPAKRMASYAAFVLVALVVSAFFSILAILGGSVQYLGTAFGFTVLGSGTLALAWSDAYVNLVRYLISTQAHESMKSSFALQKG